MAQQRNADEGESAVEAPKAELTFKKVWSSPKLRRLVTEATEGKLTIFAESLTTVTTAALS